VRVPVSSLLEPNVPIGLGAVRGLWWYVNSHAGPGAPVWGGFASNLDLASLELRVSVVASTCQCVSVNQMASACVVFPVRPCKSGLLVLDWV
jgi:hypothetical protein